MESDKHVGAEITDSDELNAKQCVCAIRVRGTDKARVKQTAALFLFTVCAFSSHTLTLTLCIET